MTDEKTLQLFLYSMETYDKFATSLPINKKFQSLKNGLPCQPITSEISEENFIRVNVRLMLQRKYTQRSESVHIPKVLIAAKKIIPTNSDRYDELFTRYTNIGTQPFEISMPDGEIGSSLFHAVQDLTYGVLLHADADKIIHLLQVPESMRISFTCKYVMEIEELLGAIKNELINDGQKSFSINNNHDRSVAVYWGNSDEHSRSISNSPYWTNLIGHNLTLDDLLAMVPSMSQDDKAIYLVCSSFVNLLREEVLRIDRLEKLVAPWTIKDWDEFGDASNLMKKHSLGMSLKIGYSDDANIAIVELLPNVDEPFSITKPQIIESGSMTLVRVSGNWKVLEISPFCDT